MKKLNASVLAIALAGTLSVGAAAAGAQSITAALRPDITVVVNGVEQKKMTDMTGKQVYPLSYEGTVYLPISALGDVLSHDAVWNGDTQTITLTTKERLPAFTNIEGAEKAIAALEAEITALKSAGTYEGRAKQYAENSAKLDDFSDDLDLVYAQISDDFNMGRVSYDTYRALMARLDKVTERRKAAMDALEKKTIADTSGYQTAYNYNKARLNELDTALKTVEAKISALVSGSIYTERVKQYNTLDKELSPLQTQQRKLMDDINDDLRENRLTYSEYNTLSTQADGLDNRMKSARESLEKKTISIGDDKPGQAPGSADYQSFAAQIADLEKRAANDIKNAESYKPAQGSNNNKQAYRSLLAKLDALDKEADQLDDALEGDYRQGKLTQAEYRSLEKSLDKIEDSLDHAEDRLDDLYDDDDDWDD